MGLLIRYALTLAILTLVWKDAHWAVALTVTLLTIGLEMLGLLTVFIVRRLDQLEKERRHAAGD